MADEPLDDLGADLGADLGDEPAGLPGVGRFRPGRIAATSGVLEALGAAGLSPWALLSRHLRGDWGELADGDRRENERALAAGVCCPPTACRAGRRTRWCG